MKKHNKEITCDIIETHGFLNDKKDKVYAKVSWNGNEPKDEIRKCYTDKDDNFKLSSGIALSDDEIETLYKLSSLKKTKENGINFDEIFDSATNITEKREKGYVTENGFIVLKYKPGFHIK